MKSMDKWTDKVTGKRYVAVPKEDCEGCFTTYYSAECRRTPHCSQGCRPDQRSIIWREVKPARKPDAVAVNRLALDMYVLLQTKLDEAVGVKTKSRPELPPHVRQAYLALARWVLRRYERKS